MYLLLFLYFAVQRTYKLLYIYYYLPYRPDLCFAELGTFLFLFLARLRPIFTTLMLFIFYLKKRQMLVLLAACQHQVPIIHGKCFQHELQNGFTNGESNILFS